MRGFLSIVLICLAPAMVSAQSLEINKASTDSSGIQKISTELITGTKSKSILPLKGSSRTLLSTGMFGFGVLAIKNHALRNLDLNIRKEILEEPKNPINSKVDDVLQYVPAYGAFALNAVGIKGRSNFIDKAAIYMLSNTIMSQSVSKMKRAFGKVRPDGSNSRSFPSGHAATAFSAAEFMRLEYKDVSPVYGIAAYTVAATTGALRVYRNAHWFSDVVAGAGVGILSTQVSYFIYPKMKTLVNKTIGIKPKGLRVDPLFQSNAVGLSVSFSPN